MTRYRDSLPQLSGKMFLTDSGLETYMMFKEGIDIPHLAAFHALQSETGRKAHIAYLERHVAVARDAGAGIVIGTPTWRASADWGQQLGYSHLSLLAANRAWADVVTSFRDEHDRVDSPIVVTAELGPRGDGYTIRDKMTPGEAEAYHLPQMEVFAETNVDMVSAITLTYVEEAIGFVRAAQSVNLPIMISFTVEIGGCLPSGQSVRDAILEVDAATDSAAAYFMINCAHPDHFLNQLDGGEWMSRLFGIRANASRCSHEELDNATELDEGNPEELGRQLGKLTQQFPNMTIMGGCCGTDHRHIAHIAAAVKAAA